MLQALCKGTANAPSDGQFTNFLVENGTSGRRKERRGREHSHRGNKVSSARNRSYLIGLMEKPPAIRPVGIRRAKLRSFANRGSPVRSGKNFDLPPWPEFIKIPDANGGLIANNRFYAFREMNRRKLDLSPTAHSIVARAHLAPPRPQEVRPVL